VLKLIKTLLKKKMVGHNRDSNNYCCFDSNCPYLQKSYNKFCEKHTDSIFGDDVKVKF